MHQAIVELLQAQIAELKEERKILYDRLGLIGLGGPLFHSPPAEIVTAEEEPEPVKDAEAAVERLLAMRKRPTQLAAALQAKLDRDHRKAQTGPAVKWVPEGQPENPALARLFAKAEEEGRKQA